MSIEVPMLGQPQNTIETAKEEIEIPLENFEEAESETWDEEEVEVRHQSKLSFWGQKVLYCCYFIIALSIVSTFVCILIMGIFYSRLDLANVDYETEPWPVVDDEGYYQSYKENGSWSNWWARTQPSVVTILSGFIFSRDESSIPSSGCTSGSGDCPLDEYLPVLKPYWLTNPAQFGSGGIRATWIGHASVLAEIDGSIVLTDPIFSERCSPVQWAGVKRFRPPACTVDQLPEIVDAVVISHTHYDHLDLNSVVQLHNRYGNRIHWFVPGGSKSWFEDRGIASDNIHDMVWWQEVKMPMSGGQPQDPTNDNTPKIIFTPGNHYSRRGIVDHNKALWGSWTVIGKQGHKFWFGGDTAYSDVFKQIGKRYGPFDMSAIPIGAYNPRETMKFFHVNPEEAVKIHQDIQSKLSFGIHWATFKLTLEHFMEPKKIINQLTTADVNLAPFKTPNIGETIEGNSSPNN